MPADALALALGAAVLHALWNLLLARERDTEAATAVAVASLVVVLVLPAALTWRVQGAAVPFIAGSAALELAYVGLLAAAYRRFELSVVYPVARGLAPVLALVLTVLVTVNGPSGGEVGGVLAVAAGGLPRRGGVPGPHGGNGPAGGEVGGVLAVAAGVLLVRGGIRGSIGGLGFGAVIAAAIAGYTVVDRYGIHHATAAPYLMLVMAGPALAYSLAIGPARVRRAVSPATVVVGAAS